MRRLQEWALLAFAVTLPLGQAPPEITLVLGLAVLALRAVVERRLPRLPRGPLLLALLLWFAAALASMHNSADLHASVSGLRKLVKWFGLCLLVVDTADSPAALRRLALACLAGLGLEVFDGVWQAAAGWDLFYRRAPHLVFGSVTRLTGTFRHPADLSIYLVSLCPFAVVLGLVGERRRRGPLLALSVLTSAVLLLCFNRAGILALAASLLVLALLLRRWAPAALGAAAVAVQAATVPSAVRAWSASMPSLLQKLTEPERLMYWQTALRMITAHPWIGVGINTFVKAYPAYRGSGDPYGQAGPYAHNQYLQLTAELGIAGLVAFLAVLCCTCAALARVVKARGASPELAAVASAVGAGLAAYLIMGCLESALFYGRVSLVFWMLVGLASAADALRSRGQGA